MSRSGQERGHKRLPHSFRVELAARDGAICAICGKPIVTADGGTLDHIVPRAFGGRDRIENLQLAHFRCNTKKGTSGMTREMRIAQREGRIG